MKTNLLIAGTMIILLSGCAKTSTDNNSPANNNTYSNKSSVQLKDSYQLNDNGCDTGKHSFTASSDEDLKNQVCAALQDENLNKSCAQPLRRNLFDSKCKGIAWSPKNSTKTESTQGLYVLQITALNFLKGGFESCDVKDQIFTFSGYDKGVETIICINSRVKLVATSNEGLVKFSATDLTSGSTLDGNNGFQIFELGKTQAMLRSGFENPYGFTYVMAEEVTGYDQNLLAQWNKVNTKMAKLRALVLTTEQYGYSIPAEIKEEIKAVELELQEISQKIKESKK